MQLNKYKGKQLIKFIGKVELYVAIILLVLIVGLLAVNVGLRYVFHKPAMWINPTIILLFIWASMFSVSYVYKEKGHISIKLIVERFSKSSKIIIDLVIYLIIILTLLLVIVGTVKILPVHAKRFITGLGISRIWFSYGILFPLVSILITTIYFSFITLLERDFHVKSNEKEI